MVARAYSPDLVEIIRDINKYSNNTMARQLFLSLGAEFRNASDADDSLAAEDDPFTIGLGRLTGGFGYQLVKLIIWKREQQRLAIDPLLFQPGHYFVNPVDVRAVCVDLLEDIARVNEMVIDTPAPRARMRGFGPSSLDFELLGWIRYPEQRGLATHRLLIAIEKRFREEKVVIPFPQQDLHIKTMPGPGPAEKD